MVRRNNQVKTVLITRFSAVGDIAMTIPLLYPLCESNTDCRFIFVSRERFEQFFINKPKNLDFIGINTDKYKGPWGLFKLYRLLDKEHPDAFADLHNVLRTKILRTYFRVFSRTVCAHIVKGRSEKRALVRKKDKCTMQLKSTFARYREVFEKIGLKTEGKFSSVFKNRKGDISDLLKFIPQKGNDRWIGIAPFARHKGKIYPTERMETVVKELSATDGTKIFLFGNGPEEKNITDSWCSKYPNTISFIGKSDFSGELRLISHLDVMVCMDSANMHMASLVNTPAISIWGATSPLAGFLGWNQKRSNCIELPLPCRPCSIFGNKPCIHNDYRCMNIEPGTVIERINTETGR